MICILFNERPEGTKFTPGAYSWVPDSQGEKYIEEGYGEEYSPGGAPNTLPDDIPGREALQEAGFNDLEAVRAIDDFDTIDGIGQKTEEKIIEYLKNR